MTYWLKLQLFADGDGGTSSEGNDNGGDNIPDSIPPRAREHYRKAMEKTQAQPVPQPEGDAEEVATPQQQKLSYEDLIKSDDYKKEHEAYMQKTIGERLKKYKGLEERQTKSDELLGIFAQKYGLDSASETFLDDLKAKAENDDELYEGYAMEHDISTEEAKRFIELERKVASAETQRRLAEQHQREQEEQALKMERWNRLQMNAEQTKQRFPSFNLENELKDERFARLCAVNNDDTTAAYMACHWDEVIRNTAQTASTQAQIQTSNAIASGKNRPVENGLSTNATAVVSQDFSKMNIDQIRAYAAEQRRLKR